MVGSQLLAAFALLAVGATVSFLLVNNNSSLRRSDASSSSGVAAVGHVVTLVQESQKELKELRQLVEAVKALQSQQSQQLQQQLQMQQQQQQQQSQQNSAAAASASSAPVVIAAPASAPSVASSAQPFVSAFDRVAEFDKIGRAEDAGTLARCKDDEGFGLIDQWFSTRQDICKPSGNSNAAASSIVCFKMHTPPDDFALCYSQNSVVRDSLALSRMVIKWQASQMRHILPPAVSNAAINVADEQAFFVHGCSTSSAKVLNYFGTSMSVSNEALECKHTVEHPVFFVTRYDHTNMFHGSEDFITVFESFALLRKDPVALAALSGKQIEVVITDIWTEGFYTKLWQRIGWPFKIRYLKTEPFPANTCFKFAIHNAFAAHSTLSDWSKTSKNCPSTVLKGYSSWVRELLEDYGPPLFPWRIELPKQEIQNTGIRVFRVLYVSRSHFEHTHPLNSWQQGRVMNNDHEIILALQRAVLEKNLKSCIYAPGSCKETTLFHFQAIEPSELEFTELYWLYSHTHILIGAHGAALAGMFFMQAPSHVVELTNVGNGPIFQNVAMFLGHNLQITQSGKGMIGPLEGAVNALNRLMDEYERRPR